MRKQTDLAKVKQTARSLLFTDIHETEFSPVIVSHPFTDSGFVASPNADGEIGLLNITESDADQRRWREYMRSNNPSNSSSRACKAASSFSLSLRSSATLC